MVEEKKGKAIINIEIELNETFMQVLKESMPEIAKILGQIKKEN